MRGYNFSIICGIMCVLLVNAATGRTIIKDTRWGPENGPVRLFSDLVIARGACLTITPGTRIIIGAPHDADTLVRQYDAIDQKLISIKVQGTIIAVGKDSRRIIFSPDSSTSVAPFWYGIILQQADDQFTEISHTDITGAYCGITIDGCAPVIRKSIIEYNHVGIYCCTMSAPQITNCTIVFNTSAGIRTTASNPVILNNIIAFNRNNGIWCDGAAKIACSFNCIAQNSDGNFMECDPELGVPVKSNKNNDSIDLSGNVLLDPVFIGSPAELKCRERDVTLPTEKKSVKDSVIAAIVNIGRKPPAKSAPVGVGRYQLSEYSPCINAGDPSKEWNDTDASRNDIGVHGGPEFISKK